jgi:hypothetical protein
VLGRYGYGVGEGRRTPDEVAAYIFSSQKLSAYYIVQVLILLCHGRKCHGPVANLTDNMIRVIKSSFAISYKFL